MNALIKILAFSVLLIGVSACGRRGNLEPPPSPSTPQTGASEAADPTKVTPRRPPAITAPKRELFIDPLLD
jgi:predicted small lipoprotein YifL